jgi:hypothetical protein
VQKLIDEEFEGIVHLRTSSFQKRVSTARHDFIKLSGAENKLEALLQVVETLISPSLLCTYTCLSIQSSLELDNCIKIPSKLVLYMHSPLIVFFVSTVM